MEILVFALFTTVGIGTIATSKRLARGMLISNLEFFNVRMKEGGKWQRTLITILRTLVVAVGILLLCAGPAYLIGDL